MVENNLVSKIFLQNGAQVKVEGVSCKCEIRFYSPIAEDDEPDDVKRKSVRIGECVLTRPFKSHHGITIPTDTRTRIMTRPNRKEIVVWSAGPSVYGPSRSQRY